MADINPSYNPATIPPGYIQVTHTNNDDVTVNVVPADTFPFLTPNCKEEDHDCTPWAQFKLVIAGIVMLVCCIYLLFGPKTKHHHKLI